MQKMTYPGFNLDSHGMTQLGRIVLSARVFGIIADDEDCEGWDLGRMQVLMNLVEQEWDRYGGLPSTLPPELADRHRMIFDAAMARALSQGWDARLGDED